MMHHPSLEQSAIDHTCDQSLAACRRCFGTKDKHDVCIFWWLGTILSSTSYLPIWVNLLAGVVSGAEREALFSSGKRDSQSGEEVLVHHAQLAAAFSNSCKQKKDHQRCRLNSPSKCPCGRQSQQLSTQPFVNISARS